MTFRSRRLAAGAVGLGSAVSAAITNHRALGPAQAKIMAAGGSILLLLAAAAVALPRLITLPLALLSAWIAAILLVRAWRLRATRKGSGASAQPGLPHP